MSFQEDYLVNLSKEMRKIILEISYQCGHAAHLGGGLSIVDILATLYGGIANFDTSQDKNRFILSKGHGVLGLLAVLYCKGFISKEEIFKFQKNGSEFIAHPIANPSIGIESSNGSLGQGLSFGIGIALSYKKKKKNENIFVLMGDGECYEGSVWEAAISATESNLTNLTAIIDCNGHQNDGKINDKMNYFEIQNKWKGFGWHTIVCDGHNHKQLFDALSYRDNVKPTAVIAKTIKGKGVQFMENNNDWHHNRLTEKFFQQAMKEL